MNARLEGVGSPLPCAVTLSLSKPSPWPTAPDGDGASLVLISPASSPAHGDATNWRAGFVAGGTPGGTDTATYRSRSDLNQTRREFICVKVVRTR